MVYRYGAYMYLTRYTYNFEQISQRRHYYAPQAIYYKNLMRLVFLTFIVSPVYAITRITLAPTVAPPSEITVRVKSDYVLMLVQCVLGLLAMMLPGYLRRKVRLDIPNVIMITYAFFLYCVYCAIYLGEVRNFYFNVTHWDTILHTFSGVALGALGFSLVSLLNKSESDECCQVFFLRGY